MQLSQMRKEYSHELCFQDLDPDPIQQFSKWLQEATAAQVLEPNAMTLATASTEGIPSARIVLLKGIEEDGFIFFTNYESQKGKELAQNPQAALVFFWGELERQVRIAGSVEKISAEKSEEYFHLRPRGAQLGAWVSPQSRAIADRSFLEEHLKELEKHYQDQEIPLPPYWGGYRLIPREIEFWQGRPNRLHDRLRYSREEKGGWKIERLAP